MKNIPDPRHLAHGFEIPSEGYCDQPYVVKTDDGAWLCVMTTGTGHEGQKGQHVISIRSFDQGKTWDKPVNVEPASGPEASYAVMAKSEKSSRIFVFYNFNSENVREVKREDSGVYDRVDSLGDFVFKYSDDHGRSWSNQHHKISVRDFEVDRQNIYAGKIRFFWNVGRPIVHREKFWVPLHKVGAMGKGFFAQSEGALLFSDNLFSEKDPGKIIFKTLPEGDSGLRTPLGGGRIAEEQSISMLSDESLYCVYRSIDGYPVDTYSQDGGRTWSTPTYKKYSPQGRFMKNPRAANFAWKLQNGKFLYWFHNHGGQPLVEFAKTSEWGPYDHRNPVWLSCGTEIDTEDGKRISWSEPEICLYDDDTYIRISYPDLVEEGGKYFLTETQKSTARTHEIPSSILQALFSQKDNCQITERGVLLDLTGPSLPAAVAMPKLPHFLERDHSVKDNRGKDLRQGFSVELTFQLHSLEAGQILLDNRLRSGKGFCLTTTSDQTLKLTLHDGKAESSWDLDSGALVTGKVHHLVAIVDGGPKLILFVLDGNLCDGGDARQFGWGRFSPQLQDVDGAEHLRIAPNVEGAVKQLRVYDRALLVSEAVGNFNSARKN
jgi:hypothetical protein